MNYSMVLWFLGILLLGSSVLQILPVICELYYQEGILKPLLTSVGLTALLGGFFYLVGRKRQNLMFRREGLAIVGLGWILVSATGALPFYLTGVTDTFTDAFFETMSGLTTTGASILTDIESVPRAVLFWRSFNHWLGGLGIVMLFVAVLPVLGAGGRHLFKSEVPGPVREGMTPRIRETAAMLWKIYLIFTLSQTILLMLFGMDLFESLAHTFGTLATGGFSTRNTSISAFNSVGIEIILIVFMVLAGSNFSLHYQFSRVGWRAYLKNTEWCMYILVLVVASLLLAGLLYFQGQNLSAGQALRDSSFTTVSIMTTTGFCTADYDQWSGGARILLLVLMYVGGCGGSTGGGLKVIRFVLLIKILRYQTELIFRPHAVRSIKVDGQLLPDELQRSVMTYLGTMMFLVGGATVMVGLLEPSLDLDSALSTVSATVNNIGPGLGAVGPTQNYAFFSIPTKWLLSLLMLIGRLEIFAVLVLFRPAFWKLD